MVKISNKKKMMVYYNILMIIFQINFFWGISTFFLSVTSLYIHISNITLALAIILIFKRLHYFEYEFSGEVISLKMYHIFKKSYLSSLEIPKEKLYSYKLDKSLWSYTLWLSINSDKANRKPLLKYTLYGIDAIHYNSIDNSLKIAVKARF